MCENPKRIRSDNSELNNNDTTLVENTMPTEQSETYFMAELDPDMRTLFLELLRPLHPEAEGPDYFNKIQVSHFVYHSHLQDKPTRTILLKWVSILPAM